jgi:hypothetical protein
MKNERNITITEINIIAKVNHPIIFEKRVLILSSDFFYLDSIREGELKTDKRTFSPSLPGFV